MKQNFKTEEEEIKWLDSKGHSIVEVKCEGCGKKFEAVVENVRKDDSLKGDIFFCSNECSDKLF
jgi:hypothetical protein